MQKGQIIAGNFSDIIMRQKSSTTIEIGELLITEQENVKILLQVTDLLYGSQINSKHLELISGFHLEDNNNLDFIENELRNYQLAVLKPLVNINQSNANLSKSLPKFFGSVRQVAANDLPFLSAGNLYVGNLRSGSQILDVKINLDANAVLSHHVLITGTTGKGKSVLMSNLLWSCAENNFGILVLDPHDEYYGKTGIGLKEHQNTIYYSSKNIPAGGRTLKILLNELRPDHFLPLGFSPVQIQAMNAYYKKYSSNWIESVILEKPLEVIFHEASIAVLKRRLLQVLDLEFENKTLDCNGIFSLNAGSTTLSDICNSLERGKIVIVDTSPFSGHSELLLGSLIASKTFQKYKNHKINGVLSTKPVIGIVLEEAPRVLGKEILESGQNIFSTIAREGRKFKTGLIAITQLPSLIPRQILANMNTKIIMGTEMNNERQAIIESSPQDLSKDSRNIASLDKGEAIITSNFSKFAIPVKIPLLNTRIKNEEIKKSFNDLKA